MAKLPVFQTVLLIFGLGAHCGAQTDPLQKAAEAVRHESDGRFSIHLEERTRWEEHYGNSFGSAKNQQDMLSRLRFSAEYQPVKWLSVSGMAQDARAPWYGPNAPNSVRDSIDLHEAFVTLGAAKQPLNFSFGRRMINYGETRVIGVPQWTNTSRTYDFARFGLVTRMFSVDALLISPVIVRPDMFNNPELGNRYWSAYSVIPKFWHGLSMDAYVLRHSQNKIGGWTGAGTLGTNDFGARFYGPLPGKFAYSLEGIGQNGHVGTLNQRAYAWFAGISRPIKVGPIPVDTSVEYKVASGSHQGQAHSSTFDQFTPANHDKFGHEDLFGWRNLRTFKTLETLHLTKELAFNVMYTEESLFSPSDALYSSSGSKIAISTQGTAGRTVGQELDGFASYNWGAHTFLAGFGHFFKGPFVINATPGINPRYFYIAQQYTIK